MGPLMPIVKAETSRDIVVVEDSKGMVGRVKSTIEAGVVDGVPINPYFCEDELWCLFEYEELELLLFDY